MDDDGIATQGLVTGKPLPDQVFSGLDSIRLKPLDYRH